MKNFLLGILFMALLGGAAFAAYQYGKTGSSKNTPAPTTAPVTVTPGITSPILTATPSSSISVSPTSETQSDRELIRAALFKKNNWPADDSITVKVSTNDGTYASGTAGGTGGGGYFFAKKVNGAWVIVADGNGVITCAQLLPYPDFPKNLISECYDESTQKTVTR